MKLVRTQWRIAVLMIASVLLLSGSAVLAQQATPADPVQFAQRVIELTNAERVKAGLPALQPNEQLAAAAAEHSRNMAARDFFSHKDPKTGTGPAERATAASYQFSYIAENIGLGYDSPEAVVEGWMNSPGHRKNILSVDPTEIGVAYEAGPGPSGACVNKPCQHYWTQVFGRPLNAALAPTAALASTVALVATPAPAATVAPAAMVSAAAAVAPQVVATAATAPVAAAPAGSNVAIQAAVPNTITLNLCPETPSPPQRLSVVLPPAPAKADVVFAFDVTRSMKPVLDSAAQNADRIMGDLAKLIPDIQFGVVSISDYPIVPYGDPGDVPFFLTQPVTADNAAVRQALNSLMLQSGRDAPEAYGEAFARIIKDTAVGWRDGARHFVISFGDSVPHDNDVNQGVPAPQPRLSGQPFNTAYDPKMQPDAVDWQAVLTDMVNSEVTLLHVVSGSAAPNEISSQGMQQYWSYWTGLTGGEAVLQEDASLLPDTVHNLIARASRRVNYLRVSPARAYAGWVRSNPAEYRNLAVPDTGLTQAFDVIITPPKGTADGTYSVRLDIVGDGTVYGTWTAVVSVQCGVGGCIAREDRCSRIFPWLLIPWLIPVLLLGLVLALFLLARYLMRRRDEEDAALRALRTGVPVQPVRRGPFCPICLLALLWALLLAFLLAQRLTTLACQDSETRPLQTPPASLVIVTPTAIGLPATPQAPQTAAPTIDPQLSFGATPTPVSQPATGPTGSQRVALVGPMPDPGMPGVTFTGVSPDQLTLDTLRNFDTLVLAQQCDIGDWPDALHCDINTWVAAGGKLIIYDSDECGQTVDYSWLPHPFSTNNPGARGSMQGRFKIVAPDTMVDATPNSPAYINESELSVSEIGDANVMVTQHRAWCGDAEAVNVNGRRGFVHAYAFWGKGLVIYNGLDTDSIGVPAMGKLWMNELNQPWEGITGVRPAGLTCQQRVAGTPFYDIIVLGLHINFWLPWLLLPLLLGLCWLLCRRRLPEGGIVPPPPTPVDWGTGRKPAEFLDAYAGPKVEWDPTPTLVIGLGGTGRWVLTHLKHNLNVAATGRDPGPVRLLCLDTSHEERVGGQTVPVEFAGQQLSDAELVIVGEDLTGALRLAAQGQEPEFAAWFPADEYQSRLAPEERDTRRGTGQRRPMGRALAFRDIQKGTAGSRIWSAIGDALVQVRRDNQAQILIVGSLGGGFGSGALVDVAYIARLAAERGGLKGTPVSAFLLTEEPFDKAGKTAQMRINTLAALREIGRFLLAQNRSFPMRYRYGARDDLSDRLLSQSLLDDCFIVDGHRGQRDLTQRPPQLGVYPTVADAMHILIDKPARDSASPLAQFPSNMRTARSDEQVRRNTGVVAGIGCSTYRLPLATLVHECNVRFARSFIELWLVGRHSEGARTTDDLGTSLKLDVGHDIEHKEESPTLRADKILQGAQDPVALLATIAAQGWLDGLRKRASDAAARADAAGRQRYAEDIGRTFGQMLAKALIPVLNGEPTTYDVVHARGGKLRFAATVLDEVSRLLTESKSRIQAVVTSNAARLPMSDVLLACADSALAAASQVRSEVNDTEAFFLSAERTPSGELTASYRSLVAEEQHCRDARKAMLEVGNRVTFASDALVNELYDNYYEPYLEGALERIFWRLTTQGHLELVVRHWEDKVATADGRDGFRQALLDLAEALAKEVWNRRLASELEKDLWRRDHVVQTSQDLWVQAEPLLEFRSDQAPRVEKQRFLWANPGLTQAIRVAEQVSVAGTGSGTTRIVHATDPFAAGLLTWVDVLPLQATRAFERTNDEYLRAHALTSTARQDQRGQRVEPVQVFRAEANALAYERRLSDLREPSRLFHPLYVAALQDLDRARTFVLAYVLGLVRRGYENGLYRYGVQLPGDAATYWLPERTQQFRTVDALVEAQQEFVLNSPDGSITAEASHLELVRRLERAVAAALPHDRDQLDLSANRDLLQRLQRFLTDKPADLRDRTPGLGTDDFLSFARLVVRDTILEHWAQG